MGKQKDACTPLRRGKMKPAKRDSPFRRAEKTRSHAERRNEKNNSGSTSRAWPAPTPRVLCLPVGAGHAREQGPVLCCNLSPPKHRFSDCGLYMTKIDFIRNHRFSSYRRCLFQRLVDLNGKIRGGEGLLDKTHSLVEHPAMDNHIGGITGHEQDLDLRAKKMHLPG